MLSQPTVHRLFALFTIAALGPGLTLVTAAETFVLSSQAKSGDLSRVTAQLEAGGDLKIVAEGKVKPLPMSVVAQLAYDELTLVADKEHASSLRYYDRAEATIKIQQGGAKPALRENRRLIGADWSGAGVVVFSPRGPLKRDELDLVALPASTLLLDAMLPEKPVALEETWKHSDAFLSALLDLDAVSTSNVQSTLKKASRGRTATVEVAGTLEGAVHGVSTKIEIKGRYSYDFSQKRITHLVLLVTEDRSIGHVATGLDVTSKLSVVISPLKQSKHLSGEEAAKIDFVADPTSNPLLHESPVGGYRLFLDRRWHAVNDEAKLVTLRFVDRGDLLAQCNISGLEKAAPGEHVSLEKFQADIREALGDNFGQFLRAGQGQDSQGRTLYSVVANGKVSELPIEWHYYLVADSEGHQVAFAFTLEEGLVQRFADTDRQVVGGLEFMSVAPEPTPAAAAKSEKVTR